ncbi:MAG TPA: hypothetical protein VJH75_03495 [Patescibacteria group bacterium]|nr:hypothetical protein [Patescibacteria group bacterium]
MLLQFSDKQFKKLLQLVYTGNFIVSCNKDERGESCSEEEEIENLLLEAALQNNFSEVEEYEGELMWKEDYEHKYYDEIHEFSEEEAWRKLEFWLAEEIIKKLFAHKEWEGLSDKQKFFIRCTVEEKFAQEFEKHGLGRLKIDDINFNKDELVRMASKPEPVLPAIKLKYFLREDKNGLPPIYADVICVQCGKKGVNVGSIIDGYSAHPQMICEECTIDNYQKEQSYNSRDAAAARRRRIFDVAYLFNEMITDEYLRREQLKSVDDLDRVTLEKLMNWTKELYNQMFDKIGKMRLEETPKQKDVERLFKIKIATIDWSGF